ncbi:MAG: hypothetical protein F6K23_12605 [Okeania sp. SIO2C9]|nr:hypothetical protein [Okeania sp. SIO2C9]
MNKAKNLSLLGNSGQTPRRRQTQGNAYQERQQVTGNSKYIGKKYFCKYEMHRILKKKIGKK